MSKPFPPIESITDAQLVTMSDARFKRLRNSLPFHIGYPLERRRTDVLLAAKAATVKSPLYIVEPLEHGNGGCCGSTVLDVVEAATVLTINPVRVYLDDHHNPSFGSQIRACSTPDMNSEVYLWDHEASHWRDKHGKPLQGKLAAREAAARVADSAKLNRLYARIRAKLTPRERKVVGL